MKAAVCRAHGDPLVVENVDVAGPGPREVRVDIEVCAICHSDITYIEGGWGGPTPAIYGHEAAGVVESVGGDVTNVRPGQRVIVGLLRSCGKCFYCLKGEDNLCVGEFADHSPFVGADNESIVRGLKTGAFAEQTVVHHSQVVPVPDDVPLSSASLLACGVITGFGAVANTAQMRAGSTAAVIGVGGVGLSAVQGAVHAGADQIIAVDLLNSKLEMAARFGATTTINGAEEDSISAARAATGGIGPDYVYVTVGVGAAIKQGLEMVRRGGTIVLVGMPPSGVQTTIEAADFSDGSLTMLGSKMGSSRMSVDVPNLIEFYRRGQLELDDMVSNVYSIEEINEAIAEVKSGAVVRNLISFR